MGAMFSSMEYVTTFPRWGVPMSMDWLWGAVSGGAVAGIASVLTMWRNEAVMDTRLKVLTEAKVDMTTDIKDAAMDLRNVLTELSSLNAEQSAVNKMTSNLLANVTVKLEEHTRYIAENATSISFIRQILDRSGQRAG